MMIDQIYSYREMCDAENVQTLQRGMNFNFNPKYSLILMSRRSNAPYNDLILDDGLTIEYEGHDQPKTSHTFNPKDEDQVRHTGKGKLTQNGLFIEAVNDFKKNKKYAEKVKVYEKIFSGVWSLKGFFDLVDYKTHFDSKRSVFIFILRLSEFNPENKNEIFDLKHTRLIPSEIKKQVWMRDKGKCVLCGESKNLHFDHDLPFSKGGTSLLTSNIRLLCAKHNLAKSDRIE